jgi:hypothetical protein
MNLLNLVFLLPLAVSKEILFSDFGTPDTFDLPTAEANKVALQETLALLDANDSLIFEAGKTFSLQGGIKATGLTDVRLVVDGTLKFYDDIDSWPLEEGSDRVQEAFHFFDFQNVTFTTTDSSAMGTIDGSGLNWWGFPEIGYLVR